MIDKTLFLNFLFSTLLVLLWLSVIFYGYKIIYDSHKKDKNLEIKEKLSKNRRKIVSWFILFFIVAFYTANSTAYLPKTEIPENNAALKGYLEKIDNSSTPTITANSTLTPNMGDKLELEIEESTKEAIREFKKLPDAESRNLQ